jgi:precorrin-3B synthase
MNAPRRRNACPSLAHPMLTGDGFLARIVPSGATITLNAFGVLCAAACAHGNGIIEITARGSIQVRGLKPDTFEAFSKVIGDLAIGTEGIPVAIGPLAGLEHAAIDVSGLARDLRTRLAHATFAAQLGPKVSVAIDAGSALHLDQIAADIRLRIEGAAPDVEWAHMALAGDADDATPLGAVPATEAVDRVLNVLGIIAQHGRAARARDFIHENGLHLLHAEVGPFIKTPSPVKRPRSEPIGRHLLHDGTIALGLGLAFGSTNVDALERLIEAARTLGALGLRTAHRAILVIGLPLDAAARLEAGAEKVGLITRADDPRRYIAACTGAPTCDSAQFPARALAQAVANASAGILDGSFVLHLSGCAKGCAHPAKCGLTIVGHRDGCDVVIDGSTTDRPIGTVESEALTSHLAALADNVCKARRDGERAADALRRIEHWRAFAEAGHGRKLSA